MSHSKILFALLPIGLLFPSVRAETMRPLFSLENAFPRWEQVEVGMSYSGVERESGSFQSDVQRTSAYVRYGLRDNLAVRVEVPYLNLDPAFGKSESGFGDVSVEFQLRAWEDIFGYPYYIPYVRATIPSGDEDKGLGEGDSVIEAGIAYGDKINGMLHWILDISYRVNPNVDNQLIVSHSYIYDVSDRFALLIEILYEEEFETGGDSLVLFTGGFNYSWTQDLLMGVHVSGGITGDVDLRTDVSLGYSF